LSWINNFLDKHILPWPVRYVTHRFVILATMILLVPLIAFASNTVFVLTANSYLNIMSVAVSSIVLLYTTVAEANRERIAEMHERRAQEDHAHVTEIHQLLLETLRQQQEGMEDLKALMAEARGETYVRKAVSPVVDLRNLHSRGAARYDTQDIQKRMSKELAEILEGRRQW